MTAGNNSRDAKPDAVTQLSRKLRAELVSREARLYALWELSRRAGITREEFDTWSIDTWADETVIRVESGSQKMISFPVASANFWNRLNAQQVEVVRASWMFRPPHALATATPDFVVPFSDCLRAGAPLFKAVDSTHVACSTDLLTSILLTLSRYEEAVSEKRDAHARFPAVASLAAEHGFLERPIVDEYGFAFEQALSYLMPGWTAPGRELRVKLTHDIDEVGMPFRIRPVVGHTIARRKPLATLRDLVSTFSAVEPAYLRCIRIICELSLERGLDSALYWKAPPSSDHDSGYGLHGAKIQAVIRWARERGIEMGAHPGYYTFGSRDQLRKQSQYIRAAIGASLVGGRQHYLRWSPGAWEDWEACGFAYDSTVGYADRIGFRAGTCIPYKPWLLRQGRAANLLEIPLLVMDATVAAYMGLPEDEQFARISAIVAKCRHAGGVFTILWHNTSLMEPCYGDTYVRVIDSLAGSKRFAWGAELARGEFDHPRIACA